MSSVPEPGGPTVRDHALEASPTIAPDPEQAVNRRERLAEVVENRLDIPMAVLAVVWAGLVAYELVAPDNQRNELTVAGNIIWVVFIVEFLAKITISGQPLRFLRRNWPSVLFLALPALRVFRVVRAVRAFRALPAARVVGSSYRAIGTAQSLLGSRLVFLSVVSAIVVFSGGQLYHLAEGQVGDPGSLGDGLWWAANLAISGTMVVEPESIGGRFLSLFLQGYSVVVFATVAATLGAFFIESRAERAAVEEPEPAAPAAPMT